MAEALEKDGYTNVVNGKNVVFIVRERPDGNVLVRQLFEKESSHVLSDGQNNKRSSFNRSSY